MISMGTSPSRSTLYRTPGLLVILALALLSAALSLAQTSRAAKVYKGPRALGLLELAPNGKAHLIPIAILIDGKFYDATAYKASPVPMALWVGTVYEGVRGGVSQGLFTVKGALQNQRTNSWTGEGMWEAAGSAPAKATKKPASLVPRGLNDDSGPPVLRRAGSENPKPPGSPAPQAPPPAPAGPPPAESTAQPPPAEPAGAAPPAATAPSISPASAGPLTPPPPPEDKDRPTLKRGKPAPRARGKEDDTTPLAAAPGRPPHPSAAASAIQIIPAISDAGGPDPSSYAYSLKPEEEQQYRRKILDLATAEISAHVPPRAESAPSRPATRAARTAKPLPPSFDNIQFRAFDLSSSNEPVFVLTAQAQLPPNPGAQAPSDLLYSIAVVAREDVNGNFHKVFSSLTDDQRIDVIPRYEFVDAVDADGDGRGELLFRQVSDAGSAFVVFRVIGDQLWPLFQGTPSQ